MCGYTRLSGKSDEKHTDFAAGRMVQAADVRGRTALRGTCVCVYYCVSACMWDVCLCVHGTGRFGCRVHRGHLYRNKMTK